MVDPKVTDDDLRDFQTNLNEAADNVFIATLCLRSGYSVREPSNTDFVRLRADVTNDAFVYKRKLLPISEVVVLKFREFFDNYTALTFDEFCECIGDFAKDARIYAEHALFVAEAHKELLSDIKRKEDDCKKVYETLELEKKDYDAKVSELQQSIETKRKWAIGLVFIPIVGTIAGRVLTSSHDSQLDEVPALEQESELVVAAATLIQEQITTALENIIAAMEKIAAFFNLLESEIRIFADQPEAQQEAKLHYLKLKNRAKDIIRSCNHYIQIIPSSSTNMEAIPTQYDENYVQNWLESKKNEQKGVTLYDWAKTLCKRLRVIIDIVEH